MTSWALRSDHGDAGLRDDEAGRAPGKRALTQGIQRKAAGDAVAGAPVAGAPAGFDLAIGQSFLDSVLAPVQRHGGGDQDADEVHALAAAGTAGAGGTLPFLDRIQTAFGRHDVTGVQAHTDGAAAEAASGMGATAFAAGNHVAFGGAPDLHTAAHEAAHVVQQRAGVHLKGGVGAEGDEHERHADAVADAVVAGDSAEGLLDEYEGEGADGEAAPVVETRIDLASVVQRKGDKKKPKKPVREKPDGTKPGEVVQLLYQADDGLTLLVEKTTALRDLQPTTPDETIKATADGLVPTKAIIVGVFKQCHKILFDHIGNQNAFKMFEELRKQPGMDIAATMASKLGQVLYNNDLVAKEHPAAQSAFFTSSIVGEYNHVIANLGYEHIGYDALKAMARDKVVVVNARTVNLGTGTPRDRMQEIVLTMTRAWDRSVTNFSDGLQEMVTTIEAAQFKEADPGLLGKVWETAKGLLEKGATLISGTPLGAKAAFFLFDKLWEYEKKAEQDREQASQDTFIKHLVQLRNSLQLGTGGDSKDAKQGGTRITEMVDVMEAEFAKLGKGDDAAFKRGDNVVGGAQADFLRDMTTKANAYSDSVPMTSAFSAGFLQDWITSNHTQKKSGTFRSPTAGSTHWDGYIAVEVALRHSNYVGWVIDKQEDTPKLHCPKSEEVAKALVNSLDPFDLSKVTCPIHATIVYKDAPKDFDDHDDLVVMTGGGYIAQDRQRSKWQGVTGTAAKHGDGNVLAKFKTLEG